MPLPQLSVIVWVTVSAPAVVLGVGVGVTVGAGVGVAVGAGVGVDVGTGVGVAVGLGVTVGLGVAVGAGVGVAVGDGVGVGVDPPPDEPDVVSVRFERAPSPGAGLATKPTSTEEPAGIATFQLAGTTV
jgi:hypothetical protein